jgi:NAD(P)-dependent dehydrogenase (short-subunit alcohol dehydrogenase family)
MLVRYTIKTFTSIIITFIDKELTGLSSCVVCPGVITTDFSSLLWKEDDGGAGDSLKARIPMGRFGRSEDVAGAVAFLVSEDASYITGESILMDGGLARL